MHRLAAVAALAGIALGAWCWGCNSSTDTPSACQSTANSLCEKAATCTASTPDGGVVFLLGPDGGEGDLSFDNVGSCELLYAFSCGSADAGTINAFTTECGPAIATAQCATTTSGTGLIIPQACNQ
jgi:hypothetical protein